MFLRTFHWQFDAVCAVAGSLSLSARLPKTVSALWVNKWNCHHAAHRIDCEWANMKWNLNIALVAAIASCRLGSSAVLRINLAMVVAAAVQSSVASPNDDKNHHNNTAIHRDNADEANDDYPSSSRSVATHGLVLSSNARTQSASSFGDDELPADVVDQQDDLASASKSMDPTGSSSVNGVAMMNETLKSVAGDGQPTSGWAERIHRQVTDSSETVVNANHSSNVDGSSSDSAPIRVVVHNVDNDIEHLEDQMQSDQPNQQQNIYGNLRRQPPYQNHHHPPQQQSINLHPPNRDEFNVEHTKETLIKQGRLKGMVRVMHSQSGLHNVDQYLGIPYAAAPVGNGRFMPPGEWLTARCSITYCAMVNGLIKWENVQMLVAKQPPIWKSTVSIMQRHNQSHGDAHWKIWTW